MDGNQRKIRNLLLYIGIPVVVLFIIILLFNNRVPQTAAYKYSDILDYFQSQEVTGYRLNLGTGDMAIQLESGETIGYQLPSVDLFYMDVRDSIQQYNEEHPDSKMVQDIIRPQETSWLISLLPTPERLLKVRTSPWTVTSSPRSSQPQPSSSAREATTFT